MTAPSPLDIGALLRLALSRTTHTQASLAALTGMAPGNLSRALSSPNTSPRTARRILLALNASLTLTERETPP